MFNIKDCECWRQVVGFEGLYWVSDRGRIKNRRNKILTPCGEEGNYQIVCLRTKERKQVTPYVHRIVAEAFLPNPGKLPQVNHKDENKMNNCPDNLEWCTASYNINYGTRNERVSKKMKMNNV